MGTQAVITMVLGMLIIWGGLALSVIHLIRVERARRREDA